MYGIVLTSVTLKNVGTQTGDIDIFLCQCQNVNETLKMLQWYLLLHGKAITFARTTKKVDFSETV